jgi:hypothetical protein
MVDPITDRQITHLLSLLRAKGIEAKRESVPVSPLVNLQC